jgi:hypothetical protein
MNLRVHIERLILDGIPVEPGRMRELHAATEGELARLLVEQGMPQGLLAGGAVPVLHAPVISLPPDAEPAALGARLARSLYRSLGQ